MFVAASSGCFFDLPFAEACRQIVDLDYDRLEIAMAESGAHLKPSEVAADPEAFVSRLRETTRLTPIAVHLVEDVPATVFAGIARAAKLLRITQVTIPASPLGTPFNTEIDRLRELLRIAGENGMRLSIKSKTGFLTEDPHTAVELCQAVRGLGITLDPSYYICGPNRGQSFDQVFPYVYHLQLRDTSPDQVQVPIGLGEVDYGRLITQLKKEDYDLSLTADLLPEKMELETRPLEMRKLRMLLESLL